MSLESLNALGESLEKDALIEHLRAANSELNSQNRQLLKAQGRDSEILADLKNSIKALVPLPRVLYKPGDASSRPIAPVSLISDWQTGEIINAAETQGFGEFNWEIQQAKVAKLQQKVLDWVEMHRRAGFTVDEMHVFSVADMISGNIHYELEVTNEFPAPVATANAGQLFATYVAGLAPHFKRVIVWEVDADNHGRLTKKNQWKQGAMNNFTWLAHTIANTMLLQHKNVQIHRGDGVKLLATVRGKSFLLQHGHQIKSQLGTPFYGIEREIGREARRRMKTGVEFDYLVMGHFHTPDYNEGNRYIVGGSLTGTTELDHALGRMAPPSQPSWMVHPEHGVFNFTAWRL